MLHGIGAALVRELGPEPVDVIPHVSAHSLACARLRWPAADVELVNAIAGPPEKVVRLLQPGRRLVAYASRTVPAKQIARVVEEAGYGPSRFVVLEQLGGPAERITDTTAAQWGDRAADPLHAVAIECRPSAGALVLPRTPGLPDSAYQTSDGQLTKRHLRAITLASLEPLPGRLLWDVGAGSGSIAVEWLRAEPTARAIAIESDQRRAELARENARRLGVPELGVRHGEAPSALADLPAPDAVFIGGGVSRAGVIDACWDALTPGGPIVANAVTLEGERALGAARERYGGTLTRIEIAHAEPVGSLTGWRAKLPVVQWAARR
jgi:precorrin-6Y C5,15-methyltransferase (decarboxylating)